MKKLQIIFLLFGSLVFTMKTNAQESNPTHREIGVQLGMSLTSMKEQRFSALPKKYVQPRVGFFYGKWNHQKKQELELSYSMNLNVKNPQFLWYKIINPEVSYAYQRKVKDNWLGGYFQSSTLLSFPKNGKKGFGNNPISYTIANSLGIAFDRSFSLRENEKNNWKMDAGVRSTLLSYVIRPHYAHPYPEHFLQEDIFNPTREGMGSSIFKSGKIRTPNKYWGFNLRLGINYFHRDNLKLGFQYRLNVQSSHHQRKMLYRTQDLILGISYLY